MSVVNEFGESCSLVSLWSDRKVIVFFARHMGCRFCKEQVSYLGGLKEWILQLNLDVSIIVITIGNYSDIQRFKKATNFDGEVYVDVDLQQPKSYSALKLNNGTEYLFVDQPRGEFLATTVLAADRASKNGFSDGGFSSSDVLYNGDTLQLGGVFVLGPGNNVDFSFRAGYVGELVDMEALRQELIRSAPESSKVSTPIRPVSCSSSAPNLLSDSAMKWNNELHVSELAVQGEPSTKISQWAVTTDSSHSTCSCPATAAAACATASVTASETSSSDGPFASNCTETSRNSERSDIRKSDSIITTQDTQMVVAVGAIGLLIAVAMSFLHSHNNMRNNGLDSMTFLFIGVVIFIVLTAAVRFFLKKKNKASAVSRIWKYSDIALLTPKEIDQAAISVGKARCDCTFLKEVDMTKLVDQASTSPNNNKPNKSQQLLCSSSGKDDVEYLLKILCYVREFLAKSNPHLGRTGPTCPFVPMSLRLNSIYIGCVPRSNEMTVESIEALLREVIVEFFKLKPNEGVEASYKTIILIFPQIALCDAPALIDGAQRLLKPLFVENGLMLGEFHLNNNAPGLHNESFFPLRTPYPCLAIRYMVPSDIVFLNPAEFPLAVRRSMITQYLNKFGKDAMNEKQTAIAEKFLSQL